MPLVPTVVLLLRPERSRQIRTSPCVRLLFFEATVYSGDHVEVGDFAYVSHRNVTVRVWQLRCVV